MRTAILPFLFIFNTQLLLIGVDNPFQLALTVVSATVAMLVFAAATQGYFLVRSRWYETLALLLITFTLFRPGFFWDMVYPPYTDAPAAQFMQLVQEAPPNTSKRIWVESENLDGDVVRKGVLLPLGEAGEARERLSRVGVRITSFAGDVQVSQVQFGSAAAKLGLNQGQKIVGIELLADRPAKEWMFLPALALLLLIMAVQRARGRRDLARPATA
jgi:Domain of unknown function (DUF3394)